MQKKLERMDQRHTRLEAELFNMKTENSVLRTRLETEVDHVTKANHELNLMQGTRQGVYSLVFYFYKKKYKNKNAFQ